MLRPTEDQIKSLLQLRSNPAFENILFWIHESLSQQSIQNNHRTGEEAIKGLGRGLELEDFINYVNKAPELLSNYKKTKAIEGGLK